MSARSFRPVRVSAMHRAHVAHGATFREDGDWRVAHVFTSPSEEVARVRAAVGLADTSAAGKLHVRGEAVDALLKTVAEGERPAGGRAARVRFGGVEALVCRPAPDELLVLTALTDAAVAAYFLTKAAAGIGCAHVTDLTSGLASVDVLGPSASRLLSKVMPVDLSPVALPPLAVVQGELARVRATLIRLDRVRVPAYRALIARETAASVWEALADAGREFDLVLVGAAARVLLDDPTPLSPLGGAGQGEGAR